MYTFDTIIYLVGLQLIDYRKTSCAYGWFVPT